MSIVDTSIDGAPAPQNAADLSVATRQETADANAAQLVSFDKR